MRWGPEQRLNFIEFRLYWEGRINRKDLTDRFGISVPQASADLRKYQEIAPNNIMYDKRGKYYSVTPQFKPKLFSPDAADYLSTVDLVRRGIVEKNSTFLGNVPKLDVAPYPERKCDAELLRNILQRIKDKMKIEIKYQSMSRPNPIWRWISPIALGFDGFRWHVRAYCHNDLIFKDFVLGRILSIRRYKPYEIDIPDDSDWNTCINVEIAPNPQLTEGQKKTIERDYGMKKGTAVLKTRKAFLFYLLKRLGLNRNDGQVAPHEQHIVLVNQGETQSADTN